MQNFRAADSIIPGPCQTSDCDPMLLGTVLPGAAHVSNCIHCSAVRVKGHRDCGWPEGAAGSPNFCISNVQIDERTCHFVFSFLFVCVYMCVLQM